MKLTGGKETYRNGDLHEKHTRVERHTGERPTGVQRLTEGGGEIYRSGEETYRGSETYIKRNLQGVEKTYSG